MKITASVKLILWPQPLQDGTHDIRLRVSHNRISRYVSTGISLKANQWNKESCRATPAKQFQYENQILNSVEARAQAVAREFALNNTIFNFKEYFKKVFVNYENGNDSANIAEFLQKQEQSFADNDQVSSATLRKNVAKHIEKSKVFQTFDQITPQAILRYVAYLRKQKHADTTISVHIATIKNACRIAVRAGIMPGDFKPFDQVDIKLNLKTAKRAIKLEEIALIENYPLKRGSKKEFRRDLFILSFLLRGINLNDLARLKESNIINGRLIYVRGKTKAPYNIAIHEKAMAIITRHKAIESPYLLPILKKESPSEKEVKARIKIVTGQINKTLQEIAALCNIPEGQKPITFYTARHTYATALLRAGVNHATIKEAMGHGSITTTEVYLKELGDSAVDAADQLIY